MATRVYEYGCRPPIQGAAEIDQQISLAHKYQHKLVEIERARRAAYRALISAYPDVEPLETQEKVLRAELKAIRGAIKGNRKEKRKRTPVDPATADRITRIRGDLAELKLKLYTIKQAIKSDEPLQAAIKASDEKANQAVRDVRASSSPWWGTYLVVEDGIKRARKERADPNFWRWDGSGHLGVQIQKGIPTEDVFKSDPRVRVAPVPPEAFDHPSRGERRRLSRTTVHFRVESDGRKPIWAVLPMIMHRRLPKGRIKWVHLLKIPVANKFDWKVQFVIDVTPDSALPQTTSVQRVGIDVGWRKTATGVRVAYAVDDAGVSREYIMPTEIIERLDHADSLRSIRDRNFDEVRPRFADWLGAQGDAVPGWLRDRTAHLGQWRSCARLAAVAIAWRSQRFDGDELGFELVEAWRKQDKHLWTWEVNERQKAIRRRQDLYRCWAADLAARYGTIVMEYFDLRPISRLAAPEGKNAQHSPQRRQRFIAALSVLRTSIKQAAEARGVTVEIVPAANTTRCCNACGHTEAFDAATIIQRTCPSCGAQWDQDANASRNLLTLEATGDLP